MDPSEEGVAHVVVLGHSQCGGIAAHFAKQGQSAQNTIDAWMEQLTWDPKVCADPEALGQYALKQSLQHLKTYPFIQERLAKEALSLHAWLLELEHCQLVPVS